MNIRVLKKENKHLIDFSEEQWPDIDRLHYGRTVVWKKEPFVIEIAKEGKTLGVLNFQIEMGVACISKLIVAKNFRGSGIGKRLMKKAEQIAKQKGAHKISLSTGKSWDAVHFYKALGYKITGKLKNHYLHKDFLELSKFLSK